MKFLCLIALVAAVAATNVLIKDTPFTEEETQSIFFDWKKMHNKEYKDKKEEMFRYEVFKGMVEFVRNHNVREREGLETYKTAINHLSDLTKSEFKKFYLGQFNRTRPSNVVFLPEVVKMTGKLGESLGSSVDWRSKGAVTPVKNQGQCGSCWSFSSTGSIEGAVQIKTGKLVSLSEQQLCDCSTAEGNHGCNGGLMDYAFEYVVKNNGLDSESDYPYIARDESCQSSKEARHVATITGHQDVPQNNEDQLKAAVAKGPVSVAIEADQSGFQSYHSGIFSGPCGTQLDHGVLAVGYDDDAKYWIVKNSWGASWGDQGYIKMAMGQGAAGICGIAMQPSYPIAGTAPPAPPPSPSPPPPPPGPSGGAYEDPKQGCSAGEKPVRINGVSGDYCAPSCNGQGSSCPACPGGCSAQGECVVEEAGSSSPTLCALICSPGSSNACPGSATCKPIQGVGLCTYDD